MMKRSGTKDTAIKREHASSSPEIRQPVSADATAIVEELPNPSNLGPVLLP